MYKCPYCGKELRSARGLAPHLRYSNCKEKAIRRQFEEQGRQIDAQVHAMVEAKKREFARSEALQQLATSYENMYKPLSVCALCGNPWDSHKDDWPMKQKSSDFDQFIDFMITLLGGSQQRTRRNIGSGRSRRRLSKRQSKNPSLVIT